MPIPAGGSGSTVDWAPDLVKVADRVPGRTLVVQTPSGSNVEQMTFSSTTRPTDVQVLRLIDDAVAWVMLATGPTIDASLLAGAAACAAIHAASGVETGYPERQSPNEKDAQTLGAALLKQATAMRADLAARNDVLIGENPAVFEIAPVWSFPPGVPDNCFF